MNGQGAALRAKAHFEVSEESAKFLRSSVPFLQIIQNLLSMNIYTGM